LALIAFDAGGKMRTDSKKLREVNARLKRGEGWIGYRYSKNPAGEKVPSKFLY